MWEIVKSELLDLLVYVLAALLSVGAAYVIAYVRRARERLEDRIDNEFVDGVLGRIWHLVEVGIWTTEAAAARALREAVANGTTDRDELVALGRQLAHEVLASLDTEARLALTATVGDVREYVERLIDAQLEKLKGEGIIPRVQELATPKSSPA